ncbi:hypothetical protein NQ152_12935 [Microbacterium sp. zg.B48]|uniref:hypothetical protein n=1 Tax=unclassified Microbacterium TaxID=2609290 RepID=UPI00214B3E9F|nr:MULTISPECIES: hypothetical protein [unclassified Microbacterium]MCR2764410.1 hypothetical protein [Microbacterium sp. zg.B48]MCR2810987.1 hypothetical protein [Microbacterium sp. zg.B185]WIM19615.1 hypothetical protein QNO12_02065 [Microbacterium sp. zg-B185]
MMTLHYTGRSVLMPNDVCDAVLRYARALADTQSSDVVAVPVIAEGGNLVDAEFLLGPASQLYAVPAADSSNDRGNAAAVAELDRRISLLHPSVVVPSTGPLDSSAHVDLDR